jgi:hypothetical protein
MSSWRGSTPVPVELKGKNFETEGEPVRAVLLRRLDQASR